jgi:hypothetical protein
VLYYYEMVWLALNCNYSSNFSSDFLYPLSLGSLLFLFTNYIFCSIHKIFQKYARFIHMSSLWINFIRELLSSMWYETLKCIWILAWEGFNISDPNYLLYASDVLSVCSCIVCCFSSSLELNLPLHISHEKVAEMLVVDSSDFP